MSTEQNTAQDEIAGLQFAIAHAEEQAQNAEDRERYNLAGNWRAKARELKAQLNALLGR